MGTDKGYCFDSMSFIYLVKRYPKHIAAFKPIWSALETMIGKSLILSPMESYLEIEYGGDEVSEWVKENKRHVFLEPDEKDIETVKKILSKYPNLHDTKKKRHDADPFVIALALNRGLTPVTDEKRTHIDGKKNIANVCLNYGIKTMTLVEFIEKLTG